MKNFGTKLTKEEMKNVKGGGPQTYFWACYSGGIFEGNTCSVSDPHVACGDDSCINTMVECSIGFGCG